MSPDLAAHAYRVRVLAVKLAAWLGWTDEQIRALSIGATVHDIGKVTVPQRILRKRGRLDADEVAEVRKHPAAGAQIVRSPEALPYVLHHHERWDGRGYPHGRAGDGIPEGARLLAVVDAFDAMTTTRPYRRALPVTMALTEIERCSGTQFDPTFADAFLMAWEEGVLHTAEIVQLKASPTPRASTSRVGSLRP